MAVADKAYAMKSRVELSGRAVHMAKISIAESAKQGAAPGASIEEGDLALSPGSGEG